MIFHYLRRSLLRNKTRTLLVSVGIIVSIMLISGVNVAANSMAKYMTVQVLDDVKVDFEVRSSEKNFTKVLNELNRLEDPEVGFEDFELAFATSCLDWQSTVISPSSQPLNWSTIYDSNNASSEVKYELLNNTHFYGVSDDFLTDLSVGARFDDIINTNETFDFSQDGVYIDSSAATFYNLSKGDNLTVGLLYRLYDEEASYAADKAKYKNVDATIENIPILGIFSLPDTSGLGQFFITNEWGSSSYVREGDVVLLGNINYVNDYIVLPVMQSFTTQLGALIQTIYEWDLNPAYYEPLYFYGVIIDHGSLAVTSPDLLSREIQKMITRIEVLSPTMIDRVTSDLSNTVMEVRLTIMLFQGIFIIVSLPVIILGWYLCKTNWVLSYQQRRRELALLKVKGGMSKQLKLMFYLEAIFVGLIGGLIGLFGGNLTSSLVLQQIFPEVLEGVPWSSIWGDIFTGRSITLSTWIIGGLGGVFLSLFAVRKPLRDFGAMAPIDGLAKYHETSQNQLPKKKKDIVLLILGIVPIAYAIIADSVFSDEMMFYNPFLMLFTVLATALLPLAPFALVYASVKLLCGNLKIFQKLITTISSVFDKTIAVFTSKSIIRNQARSFRLVFIVAMALSFTVMASTIKETELAYETQMQTINTADGFPLSMYLSEKQQDGIEPFTDFLYQNADAHNYEAFNIKYQVAGGGIEGKVDNNGYISYGDDSNRPIAISAISAANFSAYIDLNDDWFVGESADDAMAGLLTPNTTLIPESLATSQGYLVGDIIKVQYTECENFTTVLASFEIVGIYKALPLVSSGYEYYQQLVIDQTSVPNSYTRDRLQLAFYGIDGNMSAFDEDIFRSLMQEYDEYSYAYSPYNYDDPMTEMGSSLIRFLNLESIYLVSIVTFGIAIIMYISINEKSHDMGLLRARGVEKKVLYKIQIAEGGTLIFIGSLFTFMGVVGGAAMILQLDNLFMMDGGTALKRTLHIPWLTILWQLAAALILFTLSIAVAVAIETKKSDVTKIGELLRVDA